MINLFTHSRDTSYHLQLMKSIDKSIQISLFRTSKWILASNGTEQEMGKITLKRSGKAEHNVMHV